MMVRLQPGREGSGNPVGGVLPRPSESLSLEKRDEPEREQQEQPIAAGNSPMALS